MPASFDVNIRFLWRRCRPWQQATGNIPERSSRLYDPAKINSVRKSDHESSGAVSPHYPNFNVDPLEIINEALSIDTGQCSSSIVRIMTRRKTSSAGKVVCAQRLAASHSISIHLTAFGGALSLSDDVWEIRSFSKGESQFHVQYVLYHQQIFPLAKAFLDSQSKWYDRDPQIQTVTHSLCLGPSYRLSHSLGAPLEENSHVGPRLETYRTSIL